MVESTTEWPRVHSCLRNWCPQKSDDCATCDAVLKILAKPTDDNGREYAHGMDPTDDAEFGMKP